MDNGSSSIIRQRSYSPAAVGCDGQCQPEQERQEPWRMETPVEQLLLHVCQKLRSGEVLLRPDYHKCWEDCADVYVEHMLKRSGGQAD